MDFVIPGVIEGAGAYAREHGLRIDARWSVRADWIPGNPGWSGIIASVTGREEALYKIKGMELPVVHVSGWIGDEALPRVDDNYYLCAKLAVKEFRNMGISRIVGMKSSDIYILRDSFRALRTECRKEGLELFHLPGSQQNTSWLEGIPALAQQLATLEHPVGLFHPQASVIFSLLDELAKRSVRVPEDVAIIVIEKGVQQTAKLAPVPLTGVYSRDVYADGHETSWLLVTTSSQWTARRVRDLYGLRTDIEERHRQVKCFWDLTRFHSTAWSLIVSQTVFVCLTYSLLQLHLLQQGHEELNRRTWPTSRRLLPDGDRVMVYRQQYFGFFTLLEHTEMMLRLEGKARRRALAKARRLLQESSLPGAEPPLP